MIKVQYIFDFQNKKNATGIRKTLTKIYDLLKNESNWIKGDDHTITDNEDGTETDNYCLIGGVQAIDGPYEEETRQLLCYEINELTDLLRSYGPILDSCGDDLEISNEIITSYNDNSETKHKDILKVIKNAMKRCDNYLKSKNAKNIRNK